MTPPAMDPRSAYQQARTQGFTGLGLIAGGIAAVGVWLVMELVSRYPFRGPNIGGGFIALAGVVLFGIGLYLATDASSTWQRWWRRAPWDTPGPEQGGTP